MLFGLTRANMSSIGAVPGTPSKRRVHQPSHSNSLPSSSSRSDESSLSHSTTSTSATTCNASSEAVICSPLARPPTPTPPRLPRHVTRSNDKRPKTAPPSAIGTSLSKGLSPVEGRPSEQPIVVFRRWRVGSNRGFVATRVAPPAHPPPARPLPYPPAHNNDRRRPSSGAAHSVSDTARTKVAVQPPTMPLLPILPLFPSRDSFSSSPASPPKHSFSDTSMLAVPLLHPFAAHQGSPSKREQPRQSNQPDAASSGQSSLHKHRSKFALPLISGPSHPPPPVPFPVQHTPLSNNLLTSPSCVQIPSSSTPPTSPFSSPPRSLQCPSATPSSSLLPASRHSQDSLSDASPLTAMSCDPHSVPFRLRGPLGYPLFGLPVAAAVESHQPPSVATRPRPSSMHGKRAKSAVRSAQSPRSAPLSDAEDEDPRHQTIGVASTKPLRAAPDASYSLCSSSVLNPHGGLDSSRRRHHHFRQEAVPYPRNYERSVLDLDAWDNLWLRQACKSVTFHKFKDGEYPQRVLDVGCGSGTWVLECAAAWKESTFVGLDIVPIQPDLSRLPGSLSERISWVYANFLERLPFSSEEFDFVHIKRIARGVPEDMWDNLLEELARVMKPGAALEIIEEDLTFPGRPLDADDSSESRSSSSTIGCEEILPRNDRHAQKRDVERVRDLCGPSSVTKTEPQDLSLSFAHIFSPLSAPPEGVEASVLSEGRGRAREQTPFPGTTNGQDAELPTLSSIKRSRSLTISSQRPKPQNPWAPQTPGNRKRPTTANSAPPQSASRSESQVNLRMAMAVKAAASCLSLSGKRPRSKKYPPMTGPLSGPSCASSTSIATTTVAGNTPTLYSSSCYDSTSTSSVPSPPLLLPPPKRNVDAAAKATLMETTAPNYLMMPYPGVRLAAAGKNPADLLSKDNDKTSAGLGRAGTGNDGANPGEGTIPENPRDHTVLETIYNEMHADRFVNLTPLSLLGNSLGLWFKDVRTHEPIVLRFPPPPEELKCNPRASNVILSAADLMQGKSPYAGVDDAQFAISPGKASISLASGARQPTTAMTSNGLMMEVDLRTLNLHLAIRVKEILGCAEAMWDWVVEYQTNTEEGERETGGVYSIIGELSRAEFDELLAKFELDMEEHMAFGRILEDRLGWSTNPDSVPHDRRVFHDKWRAYLKSAGCAGVIPHPSTRWSRSVRAFIAWKPPLSATEHRTKIDPGAI